MADWALLIVIISGVQAFLSLGGVYLLVRNLSLAREANQVARDVGEAQVRAYCTCVGGHYRISNHHLVVFIAIKNNGQSPAQEIRISSELSFRKYIPSGDLPENTVRVFSSHRLPPKNSGCESIASQSEENILTGVFREKETGIPEFENLYNGDDFELDCQVSWLDVFGVKQVIAVRLTMGSREADVGARPKFIPVHRYKGKMAVVSVRYEKNETKAA